MRTRGGREVVASREAGAYYCEHVLLGAQHAALGPPSSVSLDEAGDPRLGFLHVPGEGDCVGDPERHACTLEVAVRCLDGLARGLPGRPRALVTGFGAFGEVTDNPTGHFVTDPRWTARLVRALPRLELSTRELSVDASCIDGGPGSIQALMRELQPELVLCLGVARGDARYRVECRATDDNLLAHGGAPELADASHDELHALVRAIRSAAP